MLRKRLVIFILFLFCLPCFGEDQFVPGQMLVKFRPDTVTIKEKTGVGVFSLDKAEIRSSSIKTLNAKYNISKIRSFIKKERKLKKLRSGRVVELPDLSQIYLLEFPKDIDVMSAVGEYRSDPAVEFAEPNYIVKLFTIPDDPYYNPNPDSSNNQWGLYKIGLGSVEAGNSGWNIETGTNEVKVAVIDTGANYNHEDLKTRVDSLEGYDFANGDSDPFDDHGHGSHVSGIIGADTNNNKGVAGVDWNCRIIPIKIFKSDGSGGTYANIFSAIIWAVSKEADVINMSFGPDRPEDSGYSPFIELAVTYAATSDCVLVAAAGNDNVSVPKKYPAAYEGVISVAATDPYDHKSWYSNNGSWIDVSAPGGELRRIYYYDQHDILSTLNAPGDASYAYRGGTSMAAPFVSGLAALVRAKYPTMSAEAVSQRIMDYSDNIDAYNPVYAGKLGSGRINAFAALGGLYGYISHPASGETDFGLVQIKGNATGEGFDHYVVEYSTEESPSGWITIETSSVPKLNAVLATLDTTGMDFAVTVRLTVNDLATTESRVTFLVGSVNPPLIQGRAEYGPNPFNPNKESIMIKYELNTNSDTHIYFFDITGNLICRKFYAYGTSGGNSGTNRVYWDGINDYGETVANGVYLFKIVSEGRTIGKGKIIVLK